MTDGSLKLNETERTSRSSYTLMTSTFPWHQSVIAFCQLTTLRGSYVALSRSVCSINLSHFARWAPDCQGYKADNRIVCKALGGKLTHAPSARCAFRLFYSGLRDHGRNTPPFSDTWTTPSIRLGRPASGRGIPRR